MLIDQMSSGVLKQKLKAYLSTVP